MKNKIIYYAIMVIILIICVDFSAIYGQATTVNGFNTPAASTDFLGWATGSLGTVSGLDIKNEENMPINFYTNAGSGTYLKQRMIIDADPGHIGIGLNFTPGNDVLDIFPDVNFLRTGYGINNQTVLHNYGTGNISCGVGTGFNLTTGYSNSFFGNNAGFSNTYALRNTFVKPTTRQVALAPVGYN